MWDQKEGYKEVQRQSVEGKKRCSAFRKLQNWDSVLKLVASMPGDQVLMECEVHTLSDMGWNDKHQHPTKFWSRDIIKSIRWLMWQPAYAQILIYTTQRCFNSYTPPKRLYTEMHTADWWW
jgi:hypothetical protein